MINESLRSNVPVAGPPFGDLPLEEGEWMGGAMAASDNNLYVCAFLQVSSYYTISLFVY